MFPEGAMLAEWKGKVGRSATSLIVQYDGELHAWAKVSNHGYIRNSHNPDGDSLYGIDVCGHRFCQSGADKNRFFAGSQQSPERRDVLVSNPRRKRDILPGKNPVTDDVEAPHQQKHSDTCQRSSSLCNLAYTIIINEQRLHPVQRPSLWRQQ